MSKKTALLISEKPSVTSAIEEVYEKIKDKLDYNITFASAAGHLLGLCEPEEYTEEWGSPWKKEVLPMIPTDWKKKVINQKFYDEIKNIWENNQFDVVINAGDAGREGQLIQELIYESLNINVPILRYWADDTTEKGITKALLNMKSNDEYKGLKEASFLRMYFDWLVGMNFSRSTSLSLERKSSLGRVMTPTLAMIVNRENEIRNFKAIKFYEIEGKFDGNFNGFLLNPDADDSFPTPFSFLDSNKANQVMKKIENIKEGTVKEVKKEDKIERAPTLFNLSDLQKYMAKVYKYSPSETLNIAESLYMKKYLSYPRTESKCITKEQALDIKLLINKLCFVTGLEEIAETAARSDENIKAVLSSTKYVDNKKVSDHPALTPTEEIPNIEELSEKERNVYLEVAKRLLAIFYPPYKVKKTIMLITVGAYDFRCNGTTLVDIGWKKIYGLDPNEKVLPKHGNGDKVKILSRKLLTKETNPPARYTLSTILDAMETAGKTLDDEELEKVLKECAGLGTAATRAEILSKLISRDYVYLEKTTLKPTEMGTDLIKALSGQDITSPELTAKWEKNLKKVETGEIKYEEFYKFMVSYVKNTTLLLLKLKAIGPYMKTLGKCPKCGKKFVSVGTFSCCEDFLAKNKNGERICSVALPFKFGGSKDKYGKVKNSTPLSESDIKCLISGQPTKVKKFTWSNGKQTETSLVLKSDFTIGFPSPEVVGKCPVCGGDVMRSKKGYYCKNATGDSPSCYFLLAAFVGRTEIDNIMMKDILAKGESEKSIAIEWNSGRVSPYAAPVILEKTDKGWRFKLKEFESERVCECPYCEGGEIVSTPSTYECTNFKNNTCKFRVFSSYGEAPITTNDLKKLLKGEKIKKSVMFPDKQNPKKKNTFNSELYLKNMGDEGFLITYSKRK